MAGNNNREARVERTTNETQVVVKLCLDSWEEAQLDTPVPFLNHILEAMAFHGHFDLQVQAGGDVEVDPHHLVEDVGIVLGQCLSAISTESAVKRFASAIIPMDDALAEVFIDVGGRSYLHYQAEYPQPTINGFDTSLVREFLLALSLNAKLNLHASVRYGLNSHHMVEALFKALGCALSSAFTPVRRKMSTK